MSGDRPWGPATEQRFPVIDTERGIVFDVTLLHYLKTPNQSVMYVSEVFKVVGGKIVKIDNIGLMMQGSGRSGSPTDGLREPFQGSRSPEHEASGARLES